MLITKPGTISDLVDDAAAGGYQATARLIRDWTQHGLLDYPQDARKVPLDGTVPAKTFVLEVHTDDPHAYLADIAGRGNVEETDDAFLSRVFAPLQASSG